MLCFSRRAWEEREWKEKKGEIRKWYPVWTRHQSRAKLFLAPPPWYRRWRLGGDHFPHPLDSPSVQTSVYSRPLHCTRFPHPPDIHHGARGSRLAIRNQSFVTNKDKCYKRPPPLAIRPCHCSANHPKALLTESYYPLRTFANRAFQRAADIKRQIKIRCYLSKLWTGSNRYIPPPTLLMLHQEYNMYIYI